MGPLVHILYVPLLSPPQPVLYIPFTVIVDAHVVQDSTSFVVEYVFEGHGEHSELLNLSHPSVLYSPGTHTLHPLQVCEPVFP